MMDIFYAVALDGQWRYFTYIVDTAGLHQPPYIRGPHSRCFLLISGQRHYSTYIVDTAGLHQPPYIRNPHSRATCSYPDSDFFLPTS